MNKIMVLQPTLKDKHPHHDWDDKREQQHIATLVSLFYHQTTEDRTGGQDGGAIRTFIRHYSINLKLRMKP